MSRETDDREYRPKRRVNPKRRTPGRTRQVEYHSSSEHNSEGASNILEGCGEQEELKVEYLSEDTISVDTWTTRTTRRKFKEVGAAFEEIAQIQKRRMAKQPESASIDRMMQMFLQMMQDDNEKEYKIREGENRERGKEKKGRQREGRTNGEMP